MSLDSKDEFAGGEENNKHKMDLKGYNKLKMTLSSEGNKYSLCICREIIIKSRFSMTIN